MKDTELYRQLLGVAWYQDMRTGAGIDGAVTWDTVVRFHLKFILALSLIALGLLFLFLPGELVVGFEVEAAAGEISAAEASQALALSVFTCMETARAAINIQANDAWGDLDSWLWLLGSGISCVFSAGRLPIPPR